jgi:hypothetical protein
VEKTLAPLAGKPAPKAMLVDLARLYETPVGFKWFVPGLFNSEAQDLVDTAIGGRT